MKRIHIDRLDLDLRGVPSATARATANALGPALSRALEGGALAHLSSQRALEADTVTTDGNVTATALAGQIARQLAARMEKG